jgi:glutathione S-transferase
MNAARTEAQTAKSLHVSRFIRAPRERVFQAWTSADLRRKWWVAPQGLSHCEIDARVGGRYCMKQVGGCDDEPELDPNYEWVMQGEFLEVDPPKRLVFTWQVNHVNEPAGREVVTIEFSEASGGTEVSLTHEGILSDRIHQGTEKGWSIMLDSQAAWFENSPA